MKTRLYLPVLIVVLWIAALPQATAVTHWRLSVKFFFGPALAPQGLDQFTAINLDVEWINLALEGMESPYRLDLIEAISILDPADYFGAEVNHDTAKQLDADAKAAKDAYCWRDDAINVYINGTSSGPYSGYCSFPSWDRDTVLMRADASARTLFHELGHFFDLRHTHHGSDYDAKIGCDGGTFYPGDGDYCGDTLPDMPCFNRDGIAMETFEQPYDDLWAEHQTLVDNTWFNLMSYHKGTVITPDQWARVAAATAGSRHHVVGPRHWFVDRNNTCDGPNGSRCCAFNGISIFGFLQTGGGPFPSVDQALNAAQPGDLVRIRQGTYEEVNTISKRITLRSQDGSVLIR